MPDKIKCTYDDCFKHFGTVEAMKKHKAKDSAHDYYCKRCDMDCTDDLELLFHQITSERHVACPICGKEFKSEGGRDRHVEIEHVPKQNLNCIGCGNKFDRASALMGHIENDECQVIRSEDFHRQRAEKQIEQDAWKAAMDPTAGATILSNARSYPAEDSELNLIDDDRAYVNTDWQGRPQYDEDDERNGPYVGPPTEQMSSLSISQFPPLGPRNRILPNNPPLLTDHLNASNLVNNPAPLGTWANGAWHASHVVGNNSTTQRNSSTTTQGGQPRNTDTVDPFNLLETFTSIQHNNAPSVNMLDDFTDDNIPQDHTQPRSHVSRTSQMTSVAAQPSQLHTNPHSHIRTHTPLAPSSSLNISQFFDPVLSVYICPSQRCGTHFPTPQAFAAHLTTAPHTGDNVTCPGCYKKFRTTTAWISHVESGSRRCRIRDASDVDMVIRLQTGGMLGVQGTTEEGGVRYVGHRVEDW